MDHIEIRTARLLLRPIGPGDLESTYAYAGDAENTRWMMFLPLRDLDETREYLAAFEREWRSADPNALEFAILLDGRHIGEVGLEFDPARTTAELGWVLHPRWQGRGYATEAARAVMDYGHERLGYRHFIAHCDAENAASAAVMRKLGMVLADAAGTRKNRGSDEPRREHRYEASL